MHPIRREAADRVLYQRALDIRVHRLRDEHDLNADNLTKLKKFLANLPEGFDKVKAEMMHEQARIMGQFVDILKMRLDNALLG